MSEPIVAVEVYPGMWFDDDDERPAVWHLMCPACAERFRTERDPKSGYVPLNAKEYGEISDGLELCAWCRNPLNPTDAQGGPVVASERTPRDQFEEMQP